MSTPIYKLPLKQPETTGNDVIADMYRKLDRFCIIGWYGDGTPYIAASGETDKQCQQTIIDAALELRMYVEEEMKERAP